MKFNFIFKGRSSLALRLLFFSFCSSLSAQNFYSGSVLNQKGDPIIGATVFIKNSNVGTQTDFNGKFTLNANIKDVVVIMYIGFEKQELSLSNENDLGSIYLNENYELLDEVIVVGYGNQKKKY